jgi:predicted ArsR family transcriptional regulator
MTRRTLTDAKALRALSHPVRLALLEALITGPLTATEAGGRIDETPTTCSFHLRQLARYGFVEEAGGGRGRARPWRLTEVGWTAPPRPDDPEFTRAVQALDQVLLERTFARMRRFVDTAATYPVQWQAAARGSTAVLRLTADEAAEISAAFRELTDQFVARFGDRAAPDGDALPVELLVGVYPL